jgi:hypothetical protein
MVTTAATATTMISVTVNQNKISRPLRRARISLI